MPDDRLERTRRAYETNEQCLRREFLLKTSLVYHFEDYPFTPQGITDCIDDAVGRAVYGTIQEPKII